jgi:hypothetical protein
VIARDRVIGFGTIIGFKTPLSLQLLESTQHPAKVKNCLPRIRANEREFSGSD